jgi:hypothetical protein
MVMRVPSPKTEIESADAGKVVVNHDDLDLKVRSPREDGMKKDELSRGVTRTRQCLMDRV